MANVFQGENYRITVLTPQLVRLEYSLSGRFEDRPTHVVRNRKFPEVDVQLIADDETLKIATDYFTLHYHKGPFTAEGLFIDVRANYTAYGNRWYMGQEIETLKGTCRTLDNVNGETPLGEGIVSRQGFALLDDSDSFILEEGAEPHAREWQEKDFYFFAHGHDYQQALQDYFHLTGRPPLLPRYALGNWWSRFWSYSEDSYLALMDRFQEETVPLSVSVIDMDWHRTYDVPVRFGSGWTGYSWNRDLFPDPKRFLTALHERGLATTLNVHPADGIRAFEDSYPAVAKRMGLDVAAEEPAIFDLSNPRFREAYFKDVHHPLEDEGVDFWWIDWQQGTVGEVDPLWMLNYYHYQDVQRKGKHDIILSRYAGPGSHRFPVGFSGDTIISWESLDFQPYFTSTATNIGYTWWSHDIGGHMMGDYDEELALRWFQFGVFSPINRLHSSNSPFTSKEPWAYSLQTELAMKSILRLRHQLIPYLYTMNVDTHEKGIALCRPMYYVDPEHDESYQVRNQYMFGQELMVAPITAAGDPAYLVGKTKVWFPEGKWVDFFSDDVYEGNQFLEIYREKDQIPVFAQEGAILPMDGQPADFGTPLPTLVQWHIFPGKNHSFTMVEDDGDKRAWTKMTLNWETRVVVLEIEDPDHILPSNRQHQVILHGWEIDQPQLVSNEDQIISLDQWQKKASKKLLTRVEERLQHAKLSFNDKHWIHGQVREAQKPSDLYGLLQECDATIRGQLMEWLSLDTVSHEF